MPSAQREHPVRTSSTRPSHEHIFRVAQQTALAAAWEWDVEEDEMSWADGGAEVLGRPFDELHCQEAMVRCIHPEDLARVMNEVRGALESGRSFVNEFRVVWPDESVHWILCQGEIFRDADERPVRMAGISIDITAHMSTEAALRENARFADARFRLLFDQSPMSMQVFAPNGNCVRTNKAWEELWQVTLEEYGGYNILQDEQLVKAGIMPLIRRAFHGRRAELPVIRYVPASGPAQGRTRWVRAFIYPIMQGGKVREVILCHEDVTDQKLAEEAIENTQQRLRRVQQLARIGAFDWDLATNEVHWLTEVPVLHGAVAEDKLDRWVELIYPEDRPLYEQAIAELMAHGEAKTELRLCLHDGSLVWLAVQGFMAHDPDGEPARVLGVSMDVTARHLREEIMRRAEKLATAGRLAATIAHEINNPLEAMVNLLFLARNSNDGRRDDYLQRAENELRRVSALTQQTLGFYREAPQPSAVDIPRLLDETIAVFRRKLDERRIQVSTRYEACSVYGAHGELRQVFANLVSNALDAVAKGGRIGVRAHPSAWGGVVVEVSDDGPGVSPQYAQHLFEPFHTTKGTAGTGLGLWVAKSIVEKHAGAITLASAKDSEYGGATFIVQLKGLPAAESLAA